MDKDVEELIELMKEETITFSLEDAKTPKEKRAVYQSVQVQLQNKGNVQLVAKIARWKLYSLQDLLRVPWNNKVRKKIIHLLLTFSARLICTFDLAAGFILRPEWIIWFSLAFFLEKKRVNTIAW